MLRTNASCVAVCALALIAVRPSSAGQITLAGFANPVVTTDDQLPLGIVSAPLNAYGYTLLPGPAALVTNYVGSSFYEQDAGDPCGPLFIFTTTLNNCLFLQPGGAGYSPSDTYLDIRLNTPAIRAGVGVGGHTAAFIDFFDASGSLLGQIQNEGVLTASNFYAWESIADPIADIRVVMDYIYNYPTVAIDQFTVDAVNHPPSVPEPGSAMMVAAGFILLFALRRRGTA